MTKHQQGIPQRSEFAADTEFIKLLDGRTDADLIRLMLEFAADAYDDLDRVGCLVEIDRLAVACCDGSHEPTRDSAGDARARLAAVSRHLYDVEGFHGNRDAYYDPLNSYLNQVLARRCGIPISLGILYMAVAARSGLDVFATNTPGHFVVGCRCDDRVVFVDPFNNGDILDQEACKHRIDVMVGKSLEIDDEYFRPVEPLQIALRVLRNLKAAYAMDCCWTEIVPVQRRLAALLPDCAEERRDLGLIYLRAGQAREAVSMLDAYASTCDATQAEAVKVPLQMARRMVAELN